VGAVVNNACNMLLVEQRESYIANVTADAQISQHEKKSSLRFEEGKSKKDQEMHSILIFQIYFLLQSSPASFLIVTFLHRTLARFSAVSSFLNTLSYSLSFQLSSEMTTRA
jgi:hypothetical protein